MNHPAKAGERAATPGASADRQALVVQEQIIEIVSDSGEGAQTAAQIFGALSAKMGNGLWTVEIIPAEIEPPFRSRAGASGNRMRIASSPVSNMGDAADVVVALNEQVLYSRIDVGAFDRGTKIFLESKWKTDARPEIRKEYAEAIADFAERGYEIIEVPMEEEFQKIAPGAARGKNIWVVGLLCRIFDRDLDLARAEIATKLKKKGDDVVAYNLALLDGAYTWAAEHIDLRVSVPVRESLEPHVVMNGNQAMGLGVMASGMELCSMYPITPATSASHYLAAAFPGAGGFVHQAEDEIAAIGFAIGASYAGKTPVTITSGPGLALKTEFIALAVMTELPLVIGVVQRGGPSTGLPTRVEQGDLLAALYASPGDAPKVVMAASTIGECFHFMITARQIAEAFRTPVIVLTDANLATGQQPFARPKVSEDWFAPPIDQSPWDSDVPPYAWDPETGLSQRPIPGQRGGQFVLTGLAHDEKSKVAYESSINQRGMEARSKKFAALEKTLKPPTVFGDDSGELLVVGWGSTAGAVEEAVNRCRADGAKISSVNLRFLSPLEPGLKEIFERFDRVMTVEINYSDDQPGPARRYAQLAWVLRAHTLVDIDCWSRVPGIPLSPGVIEAELRNRLNLS